MKSRRKDVEVTASLGIPGLWLADTPKDARYDRLDQALRRIPGYRYLQPNFIYSIQETAQAIPPTDPQYVQQWALNNTGASGGLADADIDAPEAWAEFGTGDGSVVVAVIDTGVDYTHPDLRANMWRNPFETPGDQVDNDGNGFVDDVFGADVLHNDGDPMDDHMHGTHCAGIIAAAGDNRVGVAGVNWNAKVMALKFLDFRGYGSNAGAIRALAYVMDMRRRGVNVRVSSNSYGGDPYDQALKDAIEASTSAGVLFVASAGNSNHNNDVDGPGSGTAFPASFDSPDLISVGASDRRDAKAAFSSYGRRSVDLFAPGVDVLSTVPPDAFAGDPSGYMLASGTSMAAPHVAGVAALIFSLKPFFTPGLAKRAILGGVDPVAALQNLSVAGGRLNAVGALRRIGLAVAGTTPAAGTYLDDVRPIDFGVRFSEPVSPESLQPSDFRVGPTPADTASLAGNGLDATFHFAQSPVAGEGEWLMRIGAGAVASAAGGTGIEAFEAPLYLDEHRGRAVSVTPASGATIGTEADIDVRFDEPVGAAWLGADDLELSAGSATSAAVVAPDTVRYRVSVPFDTTLRVSLPDGNARDDQGSPLIGFSASFEVDVDAAPFPGELAPLGPEVGMVYSREVRGRTQPGSDVDRYSFSPGLGRLVIELIPADRLDLELTLQDPAGVVVATGAAGPGMMTSLGPLLPASQGSYTAVVRPRDGTGTGRYRLRMFTGGDMEREGRGGAEPNDSRATAQDLSLSPLPGGPGTSVAVIGRNDPPAGAQDMRYEREPNDGTGTADPMSADFRTIPTDPLQGVYVTLVEGTLIGGADSDWYRVPPGRLVNIHVSGAPSGAGTLADPVVRMYRFSDGQPVLMESDDNFGPGKDAGLSLRPYPVDTYYVIVSAADSTAGGTYRLGLSYTTPATAPAEGPFVAETEPNDSGATATDLAGGWRRVRHEMSFGGTSDGPDDVDVFAFQFGAGDVVKLRGGGFPATTTMRFYDAAGGVLVTHDGVAGNAAAFQHTAVIPADGTYYLSVRSPEPHPDRLPYLVTAWSSAPQRPVTAGAGVDYYRLSLAAGQRVTAVAQLLSISPVPGTGPISETFVSAVRLEDAAGTVLYGAGPSEIAAIHNFVVPAAGTYYLRVTGSPMVEYSLVAVADVALDVEPNDVRRSTPVVVGRDVYGALGGGDTVDWLFFRATPGLTVTVTTDTPAGTGVFNTLDPALEARDRGGVLLAADDNSGPDGRNARLTFTVPSGGDFYLGVLPAAGRGVYRLHLDYAGRVVGRQVFYNNGVFDTFNPAANADDDRAVAPDKAALLPGQAPTVANVTNGTQGINGVVVDLFRATPGAALTAADFDLRVFDATIRAWVAAPAPAMSVRPLPSVNATAVPERVTLVFPDGSIRNTWLRVTLLANERTGLVSPDVFYFGNLVGHTGRGGAPFSVTAADLARVRARQFAASTQGDVRFDFNRDGIVERLDLLTVRASLGNSLAPFTPGQTATRTPPADVSGPSPPDRPLATPSRRRALEAVRPDILA